MMYEVIIYTMSLAYGKILTREAAEVLVSDFVRKRLLVQVTLPDQVEGYCIEYIKRCLRKDPKQRPTSPTWLLAVR
jgi:hypothetical protein